MALDEILETLTTYGVVPVIAIESVESALPLADALIEGGLPIAEITFRTAAAAQVIAQLAKARPELILGAGTVLTSDNLLAARDAGAQFALAPGFNPPIVAQALEMDMPFIPGVATPSEIEGALALGCRTLKFFPAEALGGTAMLTALAAPYKHLGIRFVPTGGINPKNLAEYLQTPCVAAVGGTWIAKESDFASGAWQEIRSRCAAATEIANNARA